MTPQNPIHTESPAGGPKPGPDAAPRRSVRVDSADLLGGARELQIAHGAELYRLRLTAQGKLILTK